MSVSREQIERAHRNSADIIERIEAARLKGDEEEVKSILASKEYNDAYMKTKSVWKGIIDAITGAISQFANRFNKVLKQMQKSEVYRILQEEEREQLQREKQITRLSHKKNKSQRKNWSKWKKRK